LKTNLPCGAERLNLAIDAKPGLKQPFVGSPGGRGDLLQVKKLIPDRLEQFELTRLSWFHYRIARGAGLEWDLIIEIVARRPARRRWQRARHRR
jgi:hypothetical protein